MNTLIKTDIKTMKRILLLLTLAITVSCTNAQKNNKADKSKEAAATQENADANIPAPKTVKPKPIAPFRVLTTDSVWATPANLKKGAPVMIIYFSPDCSHCQRMMYELKPNFKELRNIQIVMITWSLEYDIRMIREFKRDYGLKDFNNFMIGSEGYTKKVQDYYEVKTTPFIAMYDSAGKWVKYFDKVPETKDILAAARKLK